MVEKKSIKKHNRSLGQHFLVDSHVIEKILYLSGIGSADVVYEVGSGKGVLTNQLCKISKFVHSFEIDSCLYSYCKRKLSHGNLNLLNLDGFNNDAEINFDVFFSSLPYSESRNAFSWLCQRNFKKGILVLQQEFAEKILSPPKSKNYRAISAVSQYRFHMQVLLHVPRSSFSPQPKVNSVLLEIFPKNPALSKKDIDNIQFLFSFRKKSVSFVMKYFNKSAGANKYFDFPAFAHERIGEMSAEQIYLFSLFLNNA